MTAISGELRQVDADPGWHRHAHHWLIDGQQGPVSPAACKLCGAKREFTNGYKRSWSMSLATGRTSRQTSQMTNRRRP